MKTTTDIVKQILTEHPSTRNHDVPLFQKVFLQYGVKTDMVSYDYVCNKILSKEIPSHESIRRSRQKLQEHNPGLRGSSWNKRHDIANEVREQINTDFEQAKLLF